MHKKTIILLSYNQERYIEAALMSVLNQDLEDLEVIISDDSSSDKSSYLIRNIVENYRGTKKILFNINNENLGVVGNLNVALRLATGDVVFLAGGDDISVIDRCSQSYNFWLSLGAKHDLVASDAYDMSIEGINLGIKKTDNLESWCLDKWHFDARPYFFGASHMLTRKLVLLNELDTSLPYEDQVYVHRALMMGGAVRLSKPLVYHRRGGVSQPEKFQIVGSKKERMLLGAISNLIELNQFLEDARKLNILNSINAKIKIKYDLETYTEKILTSKSFYEQVKLFIFSKNLRLSKRIRMFKYSLFYK